MNFVKTGKYEVRLCYGTGFDKGDLEKIISISLGEAYRRAEARIVRDLLNGKKFDAFTCFVE